MNHKIKVSRFAWFVGLSILFRVFFALHIGIADDEAYHWSWIFPVQLSYYDHPAMIAWIIKGFTSVFGSEVWVLRAHVFIAYLSVLYMGYKLADDLFGKVSAQVFCILFLWTPFWGFGGYVSAPEPWFYFFWMLAVWVFRQGTRDDDQAWSAKKTWLTLGLVMGLGLNTKFPMALLALGFGVYLFTSRKHVKVLSTPWPYLGILLATIICAPIFIWNIEKGWPGFIYQFYDRQLENSGSSLARWGKFWGYQWIFLTPVVYFGFLILLFTGLKNFFKNESLRFVVSLGLPVLLLFHAQPLWSDFKPHWSGPGYLVLALGVGSLWPSGLKFKSWNLISPHSKVVKNFFFAILIFLALIVYVPILTPIVPVIHKLVNAEQKLEPTSDPSNEFYGWPEFGKWALELKDQYQQQRQKPVEFASFRYELTAQFWFATRTHTWMLSDVRSQYTVGQSPEDIARLREATVFFLATDKYFETPTEYIRSGECEQKDLPVYRQGFLARTFTLFICDDFKSIKFRSRESAARFPLHIKHFKEKFGEDL